jgi:Fe-Mn family superoxide dismutase
MWEHAYYLQHLNANPGYVENIWKVVSWQEAEKRFNGDRKSVFEVLQSRL